MNAIPPSFRPDGIGESADAIGTIEKRWSAIMQAGQIVAVLAGTEFHTDLRNAESFSILRRESESARRERIGAALADLVAIMEPGLSALLSIQRQGVDPVPAAQALWAEFTTAASAISALLPPDPRAHPREEF